MPTVTPPIRKQAGSVSFASLLVLLAVAVLSALGLNTWRHESAAAPVSALLLPPPSDTTFHYGWVQDSAATSGRNYLEQITIPVAVGQQYWLQVTNGAPGGSNRVDSLKGKWNGKGLLGAQDFNSLTDESERVIAATQTDTLQLQVFGPTTSYVTVAVFSVPDPMFAIYGDTTIVKTSSSSQTLVRFFTTPADAYPPYHLYVVNGDSAGGHRVTSAEVRVNGTTVISTTDVTTAIGSVVKPVPQILESTDTIEVTLTGATGSLVRVRLAASDSTAPVVTLTAPAESSYTNLTSVPVTGTLSDRTAVKVTVNGAAATVTGDTSFSGTATLTTDGWHTLTVVATDVPKLQTTKTRMIKRDTQIPSLTVTSPLANLYTQNGSVTVSGTASDANPFRVNTNGTPWTVVSGAFGGSFALSYGANVLVTTATDTAGNTNIDTRTVTRDTIQPALSVTAPTNGSSTTADSVTVTGTASDANPFTLTVNGIATTVSSGAFSRKIALAVGSNTITTTATDGAGNLRTDSRSVTRNAVLPPNPDSVAPPLDMAKSTTVYDATAFLYSGSNPIQVGVAAGAIDRERATALRGKVVDTTGAPLSGVQVAVLGHPELGYTISRSTGLYDLAMNGGGKVTLTFEKGGYLTAQRTVSSAWGDWRTVDSVALVPLSARTTQIDFSTAIQVAKGDSVHDTTGTRQPLLMFRQGTSVSATLPDGSTQAITGAITVRATEYTVGAMGPARMPADLPEGTAYTYAAELTVDEAAAVSATSVQFTKPVAFYLDNLMGLPVGFGVPVGTYDRARALWIPEPDGRVIKILSVTGGMADLQVDTATGQAADSATLAGLGITSQERTELANRYSVGKVLWRSQHDHFSLIDWNLIFYVADNARSPQFWRDFLNQLLDDPCQEQSSIVSCENQTLGEDLALTGSGLALHYQSDRMPGYTAGATMDLQLTEDTVPTPVAAARGRIWVAGRLFERVVGTAPNQRWAFAWDGKDLFGRPVQGPQWATIERCYAFPYSALSVVGGGSGGGGGGNFGARAVIGYSGGEVFYANGRDVYTNPRLCHTTRMRIGSWLMGAGAAAGHGIGGWSLTAVHNYDPLTQVLFLGSGERRQAAALGDMLQSVAGVGDTGFAGDGQAATLAKLYHPWHTVVAPNGDLYIANTGRPRISRVDSAGIITTVAGDGTSCPINTVPACGDNGAATSAKFRVPYGIALGADGSLYIADQQDARIRKVSPSGTITTVAGTGTNGLSGDGGLATSAQLSNPSDVAVGPDGSLYIADEGNSRIRRVDPKGFITTFAGGGNTGFLYGDGQPATKAILVSPSHVVVSTDGTVFLTDNGHRKIRKVDSKGIISTVAGTGTLCNPAFYSQCGDGGPATAALLNDPQGMALGLDGSLYYADQGVFRVRRIDPNGIITVVTGTGEQACSVGVGNPLCKAVDGDGGSALQGVLHGTVGLATGPDGSLYLADGTGNEIRRIAPPMPGLSPTDLLIASEDGAVAYLFDQGGVHRRTLDALTGDTLLRIAYDSAGRLQSLTDADNNVTSIVRDGTGKPTAITAPFGQATALTLDANGYLASVANPGAETVRLYHKANGLLDSLVDPKNQLHRFVFDSIGRLREDWNPQGTKLTLQVPTKTDTNEVVTVASPLGRVTTHDTRFSAAGDLLRTVTSPAGLVARSTVTKGGTTVTSMPDSTTVTMTESADPRFGLQAPFMASMTTALPSGLTASIQTRRRDSLTSAGNPFSLHSRTDSIQIGTSANWTVSTYTAANRRLVETSPLGRQQFTTLDAKGRVVTSRVAGLDSVRYVYDSRGRLDSVIDGGRKTKYGYSASSGRLASVTDPLARTTQFTYDSAGRITVQTLPDGRQVQFSYDANGNLTSLTPPGRPAHGFQYSSRDLASQYDPPSIPGPKPTKYFYNADRQVDSIVRPDSIALRFGYDTAGRPATVQFDRGTLGFSYSTASGNLTRITAPGNDTLKFGYDGSLPTKVVWAGPLRDSVQVAYDSVFRVKAQTVHGTSTVSFSYDRDGLLVAAGALRLGRSGSNGLLLADTLNTVIGSYGYTSRGELAGLHQRRGGTTLFGTGYVRDSLGRITQLTDSVREAGGTLQVRRWSYVYDGVGRLLRDSLDGALHQAFAYDSNGNRASLTAASGSVSYSYDAQDRLLRSATSGGVVTLYTYGSNGELKSKTDSVSGAQTRYQYDALGNLLKVALPSGDSVEYLIDGQNRRVGRKLNGAVTHRWLYQNQLNPVAEFDSAGNLVSRFVYGSRANVPDYMTKGGSVYRLITDHLGSVRAVVDTANGAVAQWVTYDAWGNVLADSGAWFQPFGFAGGLTDSATGLVRFGVRDYDSRIGRWTAKEPAGLSATTGLYSYVHSSPINLGDVDGLWPRPTWSGGWIAGGAAEVGLGVPNAGAAGQAMYGGGFFPAGGYEDFAEGGGFVNGESAYESPTESNSNVVLGAAIGLGGGGWLSNAQSITDLLGTFDTYNVTIPAFSFSVSYGYNAAGNRIWQGSLTWGFWAPARMASLSKYATNTVPGRWSMYRRRLNEQCLGAN